MKSVREVNGSDKTELWLEMNGIADPFQITSRILKVSKWLYLSS